MSIDESHYRLDGIGYSSPIGMAFVALVCVVLLLIVIARLRGFSLLPYLVGLIGIAAGLAAFLWAPGRYGVGAGVMQIGVRDPLVTLGGTAAAAIFVLALCLVSYGRLRANRQSR